MRNHKKEPRRNTKIENEKNTRARINRRLDRAEEKLVNFKIGLRSFPIARQESTKR